jgi:23S rRNA pseudoU1915 N3-methylase RlmH
MLHVTIRMVGKKSGGEPWIDAGCQMYTTRLRPIMTLDVVYYKDNDQLVKSVQNDYHKQIPVVLLDPAGTKYTSEQFTQDFYHRIEEGGGMKHYNNNNNNNKAKVVYVIGGGTLVICKHIYIYIIYAMVFYCDAD